MFSLMKNFLVKQSSEQEEAGYNDIDIDTSSLHDFEIGDIRISYSYAIVESATVLAQQVACSPTTMMTKDKEDEIEGTTFRTWNIHRIQAPLYEWTTPTEDELGMDNCCMPQKDQSIKSTFYESCAGEQILSSHCLETNHKQRSKFFYASLGYELLLFIALTFCTPAMLVPLASVPAIGSVIQLQGATTAVFFSSYLLWFIFICLLYFCLWVS